MLSVSADDHPPMKTITARISERVLAILLNGLIQVRLTASLNYTNELIIKHPVSQNLLL